MAVRRKAKPQPLAEDNMPGRTPPVGTSGDPPPPNVAYMRPELARMIPMYEVIRDCLGGEMYIKQRDFALINGVRIPPFGMQEFEGLFLSATNPYAIGIVARYLPQPNPQDQSIENKERYRQYILRAVFYAVTRQTIERLVGAVFLRTPQIVLPAGIKDMQTDASGNGLSLIQVSKQALSLVMSYGRMGLLVDYPDVSSTLSKADIATGQYKPRIMLFDAWQVINWRVRWFGGKERLILVNIVELAVVSDDGFKETTQEQYRVLKLDPVTQVYTVELWRKDTAGPNSFSVYQKFIPKDGKGKPFTDIPFKFVGPEDNDVTIDHPPVYDIASLNIGHYRNSADYEEACYITGQPTLIITGLTDQWLKDVLDGEVNLGSRSAVPLPKDGGAEMLQAEPNIMPMAAMEHKERQMQSLGAKLIEQKKVQRTATETNYDETSEQSTLASATANVSQAILWALQICCQFQNVEFTDETLKFELNTELDLISLDPEQRKMLLSEWMACAISFTEYRHNMKRGGIAFQDDDEAAKEIKANPPASVALEQASITAQMTNDKPNP